VQVLSRLGSPGNGTDAVLGVCFLILAVLVAFTAAGQVTAARSEESAGRLEALLTRPVSRTRWLGGRLLVTIVALLASGVIAGVFAWAGAASQHAGVSFGSLAEAGVNLVPPAITIAGAGVLALGVWPRGTSIVLYALLAWSLLVVVIGGVGGVSRWILDTSVFHQMASAPAVPPHWEADAIMAAIGVAGALIGGIAFRRRDLQGG
jgi:ABC-2 type transport system permease protein